MSPRGPYWFLFLLLFASNTFALEPLDQLANFPGLLTPTPRLEFATGLTRQVASLKAGATASAGAANGTDLTLNGTQNLGPPWLTFIASESVMQRTLATNLHNAFGQTSSERYRQAGLQASLRYTFIPKFAAFLGVTAFDVLASQRSETSGPFTQETTIPHKLLLSPHVGAAYLGDPFFAAVFLSRHASSGRKVVKVLNEVSSTDNEEASIPAVMGTALLYRWSKESSLQFDLESLSCPLTASVCKSYLRSNAGANFTITNGVALSLSAQYKSPYFLNTDDRTIYNIGNYSGLTALHFADKDSDLYFSIGGGRGTNKAASASALSYAVSVLSLGFGCGFSL